MRLLELFSGTGSVGRAFEHFGWEVVSLDNEKRFGPTIVADVLAWDYASAFPVGHFDAVWASPPCTQFSLCRTNNVTPRDLDLGDSLVVKALEIIAHFRPKVWMLENPSTGLLKTRPYMQDLPRKEVCYCRYGFGYRKATFVWNTLGDFWRPQPMCTKHDRCKIARDGVHPFTAQQRAGKCSDGTRREGDRFTRDELYQIPPLLCQELARACMDKIAASEEQM